MMKITMTEMNEYAKSQLVLRTILNFVAHYGSLVNSLCTLVQKKLMAIKKNA